jgi:hypothetical protein
MAIRNQDQRDQGQRQQEQARLTRHGLFTDPGAYAAVITGFLARTNPHRTG